MTQPTPPVACTAHRYALNEWFQGVAHPHHHCTSPTQPHPTQPHVCLCGNSWPGVGTTQCAHCNQARPVEDLRKDDNGKGSVVYLCLDTLQCARARYALNRADYHASVRRRIAAAIAHEEAEALTGIPWQRPQSDSAVPGVPASMDGAADAGDDHVAGALGFVVGLLNIVEQAAPEPVSVRTIMYALGMARRELERAAAGPPPHIRQPGDPVQHGAVTGP